MLIIFDMRMFSPELFIYDNLLQNSAEMNLIHAFKIAEEKFGIERILDAEGKKLHGDMTLMNAFKLFT